MTPGLTLATKVTLLRLLGVPVFAVLLVYYTLGLAHGDEVELYRRLALSLFVVVAATDALDGYLARSRHEITRLGRFLDPLADKTLLLSALILLTRPNLPQLEPHIPIWFTALVISRDATLAVGYAVVHHFAVTVEVQPRLTGKLATVLQMMVITWVLLQAPADYFLALVGAAAFFTTVAGVQYVIDGLRQLDQAAKH
jgi:CDP-diacylglycerol--glycerol-3-phosphate 3-phosphatidyltransferase